MRVPNWVKAGCLAAGLIGSYAAVGIVKNATGSGGGGGGAVSSVNGQTGAVVLGASDVSAGPNNATYIVQTANASLSAEQAMGALATGLVKNTTTTGVQSIAAQGTDYYAPGGTDVAVADGGTGASTVATARTNLGLGSVENTALSTWAGSTNLTTLGTIVTGVWNGTAVAFGSGGTGLSAAADDTVLVSNSTAWQAKAIADCTDTGGNHLNYTASTNAFSCGTSNLSGITGLANPTASLGLTAVNGSATTAMRSDAAPALNQGIVPTWTAVHTWSLAEPRTILSESDAAADTKIWDTDVNGATWTFRTRTDADGAGRTIFSVTRTGVAVTAMAYGNSTDSGITHTINGSISATSNINTVVGAAISGGRISPTGTTVPGNGVYLPATNTLGFSTNSVASLQFGPLGDITLQKVGGGLLVKEGTNAKMGIATLSGGTVVVSTTAVTANSRIFLTAQSLGTVAVPSGYGVSARTAGTSFTILASAPTDTSTIAWMIVEPSP